MVYFKLEMVHLLPFKMSGLEAKVIIIYFYFIECIILQITNYL